MRAGRIILLGVVAIPVLSVSWCNIYNYQLDSGIKKIVVGQTKKEVYELLGTPSWDDVCFNPKHNIYGEDRLKLKKLTCVSEMGYYGGFFGFPDGSYYLVWFDEKGKVIDTGDIHSP